MEEVLVRHPRLRVYLMHAGYPMLDDLLAVMYAHPQVYVWTWVSSSIRRHARLSTGIFERSSKRDSRIV
jgi:predicted TIM-barrel fold metal-dependent hydrolase